MSKLPPGTAFIVCHYASTPHHNETLSHCIRSIREQYGSFAPIYVIDDYSPIPYENTYYYDPYLYQEKNPHRQSGELGCLYWFYANGVAKGIQNAFIIHDSMMCIRAIAEPAIANLRAAMLWYFDRAFGYHAKEVEFLLHKLKGDFGEWRNMFYQETNKKWVGCFGMACYLKHDTIVALQENHGLFNAIRMVKSRELRMAMERVFGMVLCKELGLPLKSACGCIFNHPDVGKEDVWRDRTYEDKLTLGAKYDKAFLKTWHGR